MSNDKTMTKKQLARILAGRMAGNAEHIDSVRSVKGQIKGFFTDDTLSRLRRAVADHESAREEGAEERLRVILALCDSYLKRHGEETDARAKEKIDLVKDITDRVRVERSRREAEVRYVNDVYAGARKSKKPTDTKFVRESPGAQEMATYQTQLLAQGKLDRNPMGGFNQITLDLIKKYDLTEAEILAVKVYTANDYKYINPATAQDETRMMDYMFPSKSPKSGQVASHPGDDESVDPDGSESDSEWPDDFGALLADQEDLFAAEPTAEEERRLQELLGIEPAPYDDKGKEREVIAKAPFDDKGTGPEIKPKKPEDDKRKEAREYLATDKGRSHLKQLIEEGSLHGAVAIAALNKLPSMKGTCYRGMRLTEAEYQKYYGDPANWQALTMRQLTSVSTVESEAQKFADGQGCVDDAKTISVMTHVKVKSGRDIGDLSVHGRKEKEWLLLPGTVLEIDEVKPLKTGNPGSPNATRWVVVMSHEV